MVFSRILCLFYYYVTLLCLVVGRNWVDGKTISSSFLLWETGHTELQYTQGSCYLFTRKKNRYYRLHDLVLSHRLSTIDPFVGQRRKRASCTKLIMKFVSHFDDIKRLFFLLSFPGFCWMWGATSRLNSAGFPTAFWLESIANLLFFKWVTNAL